MKKLEASNDGQVREEHPTAWRLPDCVLLALYGYWSEEFYCASFMTPSKDSVEAFRKWLSGLKNPGVPYEEYELEFLKEYHQQQVKGT